jgi:hypothetical protein
MHFKLLLMYYFAFYCLNCIFLYFPVVCVHMLALVGQVAPETAHCHLLCVLDEFGLEVTELVLRFRYRIQLLTCITSCSHGDEVPHRGLLSCDTI